MMTASWRIAALCAGAGVHDHGHDLASAGGTRVSSSNAARSMREIGTRLGALMGVEASSLAGVSGNQPAPDRVALQGRRWAAESAAASRPSVAAALDALPPREGDAQWRCLTEAIYFEARGRSHRRGNIFFFFLPWPR